MDNTTSCWEKFQSLIQIMISSLTLIVGYLAYSTYNYQGKNEAFTNYVSSLSASVSVINAKAMWYVSERIFKPSCPATSQEDISRCRDDMSKMYALVPDKLAEIDNHFGKLKGVLLLSKNKNVQSIEDDHSEIICDLNRIFNQMISQSISAGSRFNQYETGTLMQISQLNATIDKYLINVSESLTHGTGYANIGSDPPVIKECREWYTWKTSSGVFLPGI